MKKSFVVTSAIAAALMAMPAWSQNIKSIEFRTGKQLDMGSISELAITFDRGSNSVVWCGLQVRWGDGQEQSLRIGDDQYKSSPAIVTHSYTRAGNFRVDVEGRFISRGLRSAVPCDGRPYPIDVTVVDKQAQAEVQRQEAERLQREQQVEAERQRAEQSRQEADRRQREFAEKELELKRRELTMKEEMLKREEELRRRQAAAPAPVAPRPAAPAPNSPAAVKPADGF